MGSITPLINKRIVDNALTPTKHHHQVNALETLTRYLSLYALKLWEIVPSQSLSSKTEIRTQIPYDANRSEAKLILAGYALLVLKSISN